MKRRMGSSSSFFFFFFLSCLHASSSVTIATPSATIREGQGCTGKDISIAQGRVRGEGVPRFVVQIVNTCVVWGCPASDIHVYCAWFASSSLVNPKLFKRIAYNDCVVNGGNALRAGSVVSFQYANSFMYPLRIKSVRFC